MVEEVEGIVKEMLDGDDVHGLGHAMRVRKIAKEIALSEGGDTEIVEIAALLHDVARDSERKGLDHAVESARIAERILEDLGYDRTEEVVYAIENHRFRKGKKPETLEARILQDADRLDAIGAIGIYRAVAHGERIGRSLEDTLDHIREKLLRIPDLMNTKTGSEMARKRVRIVEKFLREIEEEMVRW